MNLSDEQIIVAKTIQPHFYKYAIEDARRVFRDVCSINITGTNLLTFDASMNNGDQNKAFAAAKIASTCQVVLFHGQGKSALLWNRKVVAAL